jgi:hypothetical protein
MTTFRSSSPTIGRQRQSPIARSALAMLTIAVLVVSMGADSGEKKAPEAAKPKKLVLFDGKTLKNWKKTKFIGEGEVRVKDGTIVMEHGSSLTGITSTRKDLPTTNYELSFEAMRLDGFDFFAAATFPVGKSFATFLNGGWGGSVTGISSVDGYDASENETSQYFDYKDKRWYKFRIRVTDEKIKCWVDDKEVIDLVTKGRKIDTRIEADPSKPLGFATWETSGAVRNIEVRMLTPQEVAETNKVDVR